MRVQVLKLTLYGLGLSFQGSGGLACVGFGSMGFPKP